MNALIIAGVALVLWAVVIFNRLIQLRQLSDNAWADIDVQLKRRHDLIPQVVAVVKGHAGYERQTLESVVAARGRAMQVTAGSPAARFREETPVEQSLSRIFAIAEAYPDLKAGASFLELQQALVDIENHIQNARRYYNAVVRDLNTRIQQFPSSLVAGPMGFHEMEFFGLTGSGEGAAPEVKL